jgi:hypothetical protein
MNYFDYSFNCIFLFTVAFNPINSTPKLFAAINTLLMLCLLQPQDAKSLFVT